ncbi:DUF5994 family protein [Virgisporangium aurantiacum]|uniref:Uncharacterized protein n=1 Tax=Virgisporangium aurantiacum TaxID=175570 RepID=A0A8J4E0P8_9ACTN|nr:DUF5994 family protein [Virgisporangium aurantiacum]GIJ57041.1 hypothetical protein Vau01_045570 [Virgisporangium aurantiacum]
MSTVTQPTATQPATTATSGPRLVLAPVRAGRAVLDGGWWPRSWDPHAELPELVLALSTRYGTIRQLMLNSVTWDSRFRRLAVGGGVVRAGWYASVDPATLIATTYDGDQIDLLVVPPSTAAGTAETAMARAADPANRDRAQAILTAPAAVENSDEHPRWDNDGGADRNGRRQP